MTTLSSSSPQTDSTTVDTGSLSWVMGELRDALNRSRDALTEAAAQDAEAQATTLKHAKAFLHQAHGALQIVDIDGIAIITETVEDIFERIEAGQLALSEPVAAAVGNAYQALIEYLEELLSGASHQPVRLFPYYRPLLEARGAERIHPADLFFPNLGIRPQLPPPANPSAPDYASLRKRFERALLPFLRGGANADPSQAGAMRDIVAEVEAAQSNNHARVFWWVMHGFAEAVAAGQVPNEIYIKQLFARINLQLRRLSEGSNSIAERLLRDALFFIARVPNPSPRVRQIRTAYRVDGAVPADYEKKRYGQIDVNALAAAKEHLAQVKNLWNRIASGDLSAAEQFEREMTALADACAKLNTAALSKVLRELNGIARQALRATPGSAISVEVATALLFVENALAAIHQLPEDFAARADALTGRLLSLVSGEQPAEGAEWLNDISRQAQHRQSVSVLATELQTSLRQVEKSLEEYFGDPAQHQAAIGQIAPVLHQMQGALVVLDQDDAANAVAHTARALQRYAQLDSAPERADFEQVARNIGALSFFIETLQTNADAARQRFHFDPEAGVFHADMLEKKSDIATTDAVVTVIAEDDAQPAATPVAAPAVAEQEQEDLPTVEEELAFHQRQSAELAVSLAIEPDNSDLQEQLKQSLQQIKLEATLIDNPEAGDRARAAIDMLERGDFGRSSGDALASMVAAPVPEPTPVAAPVPVAELPADDAAIDAELLEIFLMEAEEVLGCVRDTIPLSRAEPHNADHLTTLRRSFHTLKGSGRMVGLTALGEGAWSIEQVMNLRLSESKPGDPDLYALLETAADVIGDWVEELKQDGRSDRTAAALVAAAERVKRGEGFTRDDLLQGSAAAMPAEADMQQVPAVIAEPGTATETCEAGNDAQHASGEAEQAAVDVPVVESAAAETVELHETDDANLPAIAQEQDEALPLALPDEESEALSAPDFAAFYASVASTAPVVESVVEPVAEPAADAVAAAPAAMEADAPATALVSSRADDGVKQIGDLQISAPLHNIYLAETDELVRLLSTEIAEWRHDPERAIRVQAVHASHSLAGSSATVGFMPLQEVAHALEMVLQYLLRKPVCMVSQDYDVLDSAIERIRFMLQMFAMGMMPEREPQQVQALEQLLQSIEYRFNHPVESDTIEASVIADAVLPDSGVQPAEQLLVLDTETVAAEVVAPDTAMVIGVMDEAQAAPVDEPVTADAAAIAEAVEEAVAQNDAMTSADAADHGGEAALDQQAIDAVEAIVTSVEPADVPEQENESMPQPASTAIGESAIVDEQPIADWIAAQPIVEEPMPLAAEPVQDAIDVDVFASDTAELPPATLNDVTEPDAVDAGADEITPAGQQDGAEMSALPAETAMPALLDTVSEFAQPALEIKEIPVAAGPAVGTPDDVSAGHDAITASADGLKDELDADLLPVFLEEGRDMLPQIGEQLRAWQLAPDSLDMPRSLLRLLHTVKGSARMAGAMTLGQHTHEMETRIEQLLLIGTPSSQALDDLVGRFDTAQQMFDLLMNPQAATSAPAVEAVPAQVAVPKAEPVPDADRAPKEARRMVELPSLIPAFNAKFAASAGITAPAAAPQQQLAAAAPLVRVRADILDRLVNQAGEVSIARSKLETEVGALRQSLVELNENVARLRTQLREIEMQAESQITSRMALSNDREFDPLEFDRFTRLQELTRMMAESVNDVGSVQQNLNRTVDSAGDDLTVQARLTRDLQQDLMRVRMVQFASISERLYRVTRQAAKEVNKRVNLDIRGSAVEIDRGVLEKMAGPFEHLLRNAIAHGIESRDARQASGKSEIGELLVEIRQEGNEVVIQFADDGQGLDLQKIRDKALSTGLIAHDSKLSDAETGDLIFHPGFSTASEVTELAGRGIGMDVVRSEAAALGGRVSIQSVPGKGARFTIHLPLTLAVTQVVLLSTGGKTFAVPSVLVEQVQQLKTANLMTAYNDGAVIWQGQRVPMHYLPTLLGDTAATAIAQQYSPILILRSGDDRVALHVDQVIGNREVVVKNIGPQLARMAGIAGATVLGSGDIVLILNPVPLAQKMASENIRAPRVLPNDAQQQEPMGAVADMRQQPAGPASEPVQGLRTQHIVMVVDDSLTVRRVTQRLLAREGYQVVLAKDGVDALQHLQSVTPDVMLVDIEMPRMDGFDLTRNVRGDERTRHIPIIMITSRTASKHRNYALELGVNEYLGKPYQEDVLLQLIAGFIGKETPVAQ